MKKGIIILIGFLLVFFLIGVIFADDVPSTSNSSLGGGNGVTAIPVIKCGDTITQDTVLTEDLLNCSGGGLIIGTDNITLNCNNHLINKKKRDFGDYNSSQGIYLNNKQDVILKNCFINQFTVGIFIEKGNNCVIQNNTINALGEVVLGGGIYITGNNNLIKENRVYNVNHQGIDIEGNTSNNTVLGNIIECDGNCNGIFLYQTISSVVSNNSVSNSGTGISAWGYECFNNTFHNNKVFNSTNGFTIASDNNIISENKIFNNERGIYFLTALNNTLIMNEVYNNVFGIVFYPNYTQGNFITNNFIHNNQYGIISHISKDNIFYNNSIIDNRAGMIFEGCSNNYFYNNFISNNDFGGISFSQSYNNTVLNNYFYTYGISDENYSLNIYCINNTDNHYFNGAAGPKCGGFEQGIKCGDTITQDTVLTEDLLNCDTWRPGIIIGASNITLDCNGHKIEGVGSCEQCSGIIGMFEYNITIKNCILSNWAYAINFNEDTKSSDMNIVNNTFINCSTGIVTIGKNNKIINNYFYNIGVGIFLAFTSVNYANNSWYNCPSENNLVSGNIILNASYAGIMLWDKSINNNIANNMIYNSNKGIWLTSGSINNQITSNSLFSSYLLVDLLAKNNIIIQNNMYKKGISDPNISQNIYCINGTGNYYFDGATGPICEIINAANFSISTTTPADLTKSITDTSFLITPNLQTGQVVNIAVTLPQQISDGINTITINPPYTIGFNNVLNAQTQGPVVVSYTILPSNFNIGIFTTNAIINATDTTNSSNTLSQTVPIIFISDFCTIGENGTDLSITRIDINNNDGDDIEWKPLDTISLKVEISNDGSTSLKNVYIELGLFDSSGKNIIGSMDNLANKKISIGTINNGKYISKTFRFNVPLDFQDEDYKLVVKAYSDSNRGQVEICTAHSSDLDNIYYQTIQGFREVNPNMSTNFLLINNLSSRIYNTRRLNLNINSNNNLNKLVLIDNGRLLTLCSNCKFYNKLMSFSDGRHNLTFRGILPNGQTIYNQTFFLVDSKDPQISTTKPQNRRYTNGSDFYIKYTEDNCQSLKILLNGQETLSNPCNSGRNVEKTLAINISSFNGQEVEYKFIVNDIANNTDESRPVKVFVDTTSPIINNPNNFWSKDVKNPKYINFNISITELNLDSVQYLDTSDGAKAKWNTLCTRLNKNNECIAKKSFKTGIHNLTIRVLDKSGNSIQKNINFSI